MVILFVLQNYLAFFNNTNQAYKPIKKLRMLFLIKMKTKKIGIKRCRATYQTLVLCQPRCTPEFSYLRLWLMCHIWMIVFYGYIKDLRYSNNCTILNQNKLPTNYLVISNTWAFKLKICSSASLHSFKAILCVKGYLMGSVI